MAPLINRKVKASSLIEVLIAMVIILVVFVIAMKIFGNVMRSGVSFRDVKVQGQLDLLSKRVGEMGYVENEVVQVEDISYQLITDTSSVEGIYKLEIKASQAGNQIGTAKTIFKSKANEN